jgi:hypothetical protein
MDQMVTDSDCCVDRRPGIFDHRPSEICFALECANRLAGCFAAIQSTFKSDTGTVPGSNPYSYAYPKGNTRRYLISLLTAFSLGPSSSWLRGAGFGMLYGFGYGLVIFLAKGAFKSKDAPYGVPMSIITGLITGVLLTNLAF